MRTSDEAWKSRDGGGRCCCEEACPPDNVKFRAMGSHTSIYQRDETRRDPIPRLRLLTSEASLSLLNPSPSVHLCPLFLSWLSFTASLGPPLSESRCYQYLTHTVNQGVSGGPAIRTSLHLPLPLCAQAHQSEGRCQGGCHRRNCNHGHDDDAVKCNPNI